MERQIRYRGYNLRNKKWIYGYYFVNRGKHFIADDRIAAPGATWEDFEVDSESVGQYAGTCNGNPIFEGDIVRATESDGYKTTYEGEVVYDAMNCRFVLDCKGKGVKIPLTGEKQIGSLGMGGTYEFYYLYEIIGSKQANEDKRMCHIEEVDFWKAENL